MTVGLSPTNADVLNTQVGSVLRAFTDTKEGVGHFQDWLLATDLKAEPYLMSTEDETLIKSAFSTLDATLDTVDMTFINRLTGLWV
jgi:hypothetical protein